MEVPEVPVIDGDVSRARVEGECHLLFAWDVGLGIDLEASRSRVLAGAEAGAREGDGVQMPRYFAFEKPPLRLGLAPARLDTGAGTTEARVTATLYDFGAVSVGIALPFAGSLEDLPALSFELSRATGPREAALRARDRLLADLGSAVAAGRVSEPDEEYLVFHVRRHDAGCPVSELPQRAGAVLARVLASEQGPLSDQEVAEVLDARLSHAPSDLALLDWNAAIVFREQAADVLAVLDFANAQLLEMRILDRRLDEALDRSYDLLSRRSWRDELLPGPLQADVRRVGRMQVDGALLFERVSNALKLLGDPYLVRVYRAAARRFRLAEWNGSIGHKLQAIDSIYAKLNDRAAHVRMEVLEWIIIALIALSLVLPLF